jgi:hypothetical protein
LISFKEAFSIDLKSILKNMEQSSLTGPKFSLVKVNVKKFDRAWKRESDYYIGKGGLGASIGDRYQRFLHILGMPEEERRMWLQGETTSGNVAASLVNVNADGRIDFTNGRHRFAVLRDLGAKKIPVSMTQDSIQNAKKFKYI